ncbi:hypothetical protein GCM10029964_089480 [Kibdelosporangium lantanae]
MLWCFLGGYAVFMVVIAVCAARVTLSNPDQRRRNDGYKVLRLVWSTGTIGLVISAAVRLHKSGLF